MADPARVAILSAVLRLAVPLSLSLAAAPVDGAPATVETTPAPASTAAVSIEALRGTIASLTARVGDGQGPARARACKTNSEGQCVYTEAEHKARRGASSRPPPALSDDERALVAAYEAFLSDDAGAAAPEAAAYRYHLARLLDDAGETARARPHLERLIDRGDADPRTSWAARLLLDGRVREWTAAGATPEARRAAGVELERELARLQALPLWRTDAGRELRGAAPMLDAGLRWAKGLDHLHRGRDATDPDASAAAFAACAREYEGLFADYGDRHDRVDTLLWNASRCRDAALEVDAALALLVTLVDTYAESRHTEDALRGLAETHDRLGRYAEALGWYERYNAYTRRRGRVEREVEREVELRLALGPRDRLEAALLALEGDYARKDPDRAAEVRWAAYAVLPADDRARRAHLEAYLRDYGRKGPRTLALVASAELARLLLQNTCPKGQILGGLCLDRRGGPAASTQASRGAVGAPATGRWVLDRRAGADASEALRLAHELRGRAKYSRRNIPPRHLRAFEDAVAAAALIEADAAFEALVAGRPLPRRRDLRLAPEELPERAGPSASSPTSGLAALAGLDGALADDVDALDDAYAALAELVPEGPSAVRARARRGLLREWLADRRAAPTSGPGGAPSPNDRARVDALRAAALGADRQCLAPTPAALAAPESVDACERSLAALTLGDPRVLHEMVGPIDAAGLGHPASRPDVAPVILDVDEALRIGARLVAAEEAASTRAPSVAPKAAPGG